MVDGFAAGADAALAASIFHFGTYSIEDVRAQISAAGHSNAPARPSGQSTRHANNTA